MAGLPWWLWVIFAVVALFGLKTRAFYNRYRGFCRGIREDLCARVHQEHPEVKVLGEQMGNLLVRMPDGSEKVWEMADVYSRVMQQHGIDSDSSARTGAYRDAISTLFAPDPKAAITLATHGERIKPELIPASALESYPAEAQLVHEPVPGLGLEQIYLFDLGMNRRILTEPDLADLGIDRETLNRTALANLRQDFPPNMVSGVFSGEGGTACQMGDGFDAARLLLIPEMLKPGQVVLAAVPHRDMLLLLPPTLADEPAKLAEGLTLLNDGHSTGCSHPHLLDGAVRVTSAGFELI